MGILPPTVRNTRRTELKRFTMVAALVMAYGMGCRAPADTTRQSSSPFPFEPAWALENLGIPRTLRGAPLAAGELAGYTRQIELTSPVAGNIRLSGHAWIRWGPDEHRLDVPTRAEYEASGIACDLYAQGAALPFSASCRNADSSQQLQGCNWSVPVVRGSNELHFQCIVRADGHPHAFTVGVTDMVACPEAGGPCHAIEIDPALRYQGGANISRPDGLIVYVISN